MTKFEKHDPGTFCWIELATSDDKAAKEYYTNLFGWTTNENDMGEMGIYYIFQKEGRDCAAMYKQGKDQQGIPPNWLSYVSVANADESVAKAKSLGANAAMEPFDVYDFGRMCVLFDPAGAAFALWQPNKHIGVQVRNESGTLGWNELHTRDTGVAKNFYAPLFGWTLKESPEYTEFHLGDLALGGMLPSRAPEGVPSFWIPYFVVDDADATVAKSTASGGSVHVPPTDIPNVGRFAVIVDPQGAAFAIIKLEWQPKA